MSWANRLIRLKPWLAEQLLARRPVISCLLFSAAAIPMLLLFTGLHTFAQIHPQARAFYHPTASAT